MSSSCSKLDFTVKVRFKLHLGSSSSLCWFFFIFYVFSVMEEYFRNLSDVVIS